VTPAAILETCLYASDLDAAEEFYGGLLGLERVTREGNRHVFYRLASQMLLIFNPVETAIPSKDKSLPIPIHGAEGSGHVCFSATPSEIAQWRQHLESHGVVIEADIKWPNGAASLYVRDPGNNSVEFAQRELWGFK